MFHAEVARQDVADKDQRERHEAELEAQTKAHERERVVLHARIAERDESLKRQSRSNQDQRKFLKETKQELQQLKAKVADMEHARILLRADLENKDKKIQHQMSLLGKIDAQLNRTLTMHDTDLRKKDEEHERERLSLCLEIERRDKSMRIGEGVLDRTHQEATEERLLHQEALRAKDEELQGERKLLRQAKKENAKVNALVQRQKGALETKEQELVRLRASMAMPSADLPANAAESSTNYQGVIRRQRRRPAAKASFPPRKAQKQQNKVLDKVEAIERELAALRADISGGFVDVSSPSTRM